MERHIERDRERPWGGLECGLSSLQRATQVLPEDLSQLPWVAGSRPWTGMTGNKSGMGRSGDGARNQGNRYARQAQAPWEVGRYEVLMND